MSFSVYDRPGTTNVVKTMEKAQSVGRAEAEVLRFVTEHPGSTVTEVAEVMAVSKGQARGTAQNVMERLRRKGYLTRERVDGSFRYSPVQKKGPMFQGLVSDFVESVLGGSVSPLVAYLTNRGEISEEEHRELLRLVEKLGENDGTR
jgi:predicted transcriptional regulator